MEFLTLSNSFDSRRKTEIDMLKYRIAKRKDLDKIVDIYNSTISSRMVTADTEPVTPKSRVKWFNAHEPAKHPLWIIYNNEKQVVGWLSFQAFYGRPAYDATVEISIYLDEQHRGKGYGKMALEYAIQIAPTFGIKTLLGFIFAHNDPSIYLFRSFGFDDWATLPDIAVLDGEERTLKILGKRVAL